MSYNKTFFPFILVLNISIVKDNNLKHSSLLLNDFKFSRNCTVISYVLSIFRAKQELSL